MLDGHSTDFQKLSSLNENAVYASWLPPSPQPLSYLRSDRCAGNQQCLSIITLSTISVTTPSSHSCNLSKSLTPQIPQIFQFLSAEIERRLQSKTPSAAETHSFAWDPARREGVLAYKVVSTPARTLFPLCVCVCVSVCANQLQSCPILCDPMNCSPPGSSVHGILYARILECVAMSSSFPIQGLNPCLLCLLPMSKLALARMKCRGKNQGIGAINNSK